MRPRSRSAFQSYQLFQAWEEIPDLQNCNLLQKLNKNLDSYQKKYKKYMNKGENQIRNSKTKNFNLQEKQHKQIQDDIPFLPQINANHNFIRRSQNLRKLKPIISSEQQCKDEQIFRERVNNHLKLKTISFNKSASPNIPVQTRKYSLNEVKYPQVSKLIPKNEQRKGFEKQNLHGSPYKIDITNKMEGYKNLRYKQKKIIEKHSKIENEKIEEVKIKEDQLSYLFVKKSRQKITKQINQNQEELFTIKLNEFSDKKFYEQNIKEKNQIRR